MNSSLALINRGAVLAVCLAVVTLSSCASSQVDKAFSGGLPKTEAVKTITEYCQSCHIHRNFDGPNHVIKASSKYKAEPMKSSDTCQTCHTYEKNFLGDEIRHTLFPEGVLTAEATDAKK